MQKHDARAGCGDSVDNSVKKITVKKLQVKKLRRKKLLVKKITRK